MGDCRMSKRMFDDADEKSGGMIGFSVGDVAMIAGPMSNGQDSENKRIGADDG